MKRWTILSAVLIICGSLYGCINQSKEVLNAEKQSALYITFTELKSPPYDMKRMVDVYRDLIPAVSRADQWVPGLTSETEYFLTKAQTDANQDAYLEGVEKRLQRVFVVLMEKSLENIERDLNNSSQAMEDFRLARTYFKVIDITSKRRGNMFHDENKFSNQFKSLFNHLEQAIRAGQPERIHEFHQKITGLTTKVYYLSVLYEVKGLMKIQKQNDPMEEFAKKTEGSSYFAIIRGAAEDPEAAKAIDNEFNKPTSQIDGNIMQANLKKAFPEIASEYESLF